jgi:hypothetical protein
MGTTWLLPLQAITRSDGKTVEISGYLDSIFYGNVSYKENTATRHQLKVE